MLNALKKKKLSLIICILPNFYGRGFESTSVAETSRGTLGMTWGTLGYPSWAVLSST